ncbi:flavodoxin domain-containing protein [Planctobacterium marinum]|uniref:flavodoxin domain-containing protein n=1 Tax=Planctobacterium marinum TaxID=1631968 RepID=UPI001E5C0F13|nr:flavodoxin domain-containing protein [Planctobacterium marinum]MCC2606061.1 flavodoxin domain-containing protein [Planctobacterium marinum]
MASVSIFVGSVYGNAQHVAEQCEEKLVEMGHDVTLFGEPEIGDFKDAENVVVITSTTGQGDLPPNIEFFAQDLRDQMPLMTGKSFAVAALGDSSYGDTFGGAGRTMFDILTELQGSPLADLFIVDAMETFEPEAEVVPWVEQLFKIN